MATHAMSTAELGVKATGAATDAAGTALRAVRARIEPILAAARARLSAFGEKLFAAIVEARTAQAISAIERYDWRLAAQLRAEQEGTTQAR